MSDVIKNSGQILFNNGQTQNTNDAFTDLEAPLEAVKQAFTCAGGVITTTGIVGADGKITYEVEIYNYSSEAFTNIVFDDAIVLSPLPNPGPGFTLTSTHTNVGTLPAIQFTDIPDIPAESTYTVVYSIQLDDDIELGTTITNQATIDYDENPGAAVDTNTIVVTYQYTAIDAVKTAPENALCGSTFNYVLSFENTGNVNATSVTLTDTLPAEFAVGSMVITNAGVEVDSDDYSYERVGNLLTITPDEGSEDIFDIEPGAGKKLVVTITGTATCA